VSPVPARQAVRGGDPCPSGSTPPFPLLYTPAAVERQRQAEQGRDWRRPTGRRAGGPLLLGRQHDPEEHPRRPSGPQAGFGYTRGGARVVVVADVDAEPDCSVMVGPRPSLAHHSSSRARRRPGGARGVSSPPGRRTTPQLRESDEAGAQGAGGGRLAAWPPAGTMSLSRHLQGLREGAGLSRVELARGSGRARQHPTQLGSRPWLPRRESRPAAGRGPGGDPGAVGRGGRGHRGGGGAGGGGGSPPSAEGQAP
jgi:hypothetical protein